MEPQIVKLCPCNNAGCPSVEKVGENIKIIDDFGCEVVLTIEEAFLIQGALDQLCISHEP